jgi:hypothetical protein
VIRLAIGADKSGAAVRLKLEAKFGGDGHLQAARGLMLLNVSTPPAPLFRSDMKARANSIVSTVVSSGNHPCAIFRLCVRQGLRLWSRSAAPKGLHRIFNSLSFRARFLCEESAVPGRHHNIIG